jgi:hypothetical protein
MITIEMDEKLNQQFMRSLRWLSELFAAIAVAWTMPGIVQAQDTVVADNVVLVHGLYADGSSWIDVIPYLQRAGLKVTAVQNPLTSLADERSLVKPAMILRFRH